MGETAYLQAGDLQSRHSHQSSHTKIEIYNLTYGEIVQGSYIFT